MAKRPNKTGQTTDISSLTNSILMEDEKVFRRNGLAAEFHERYHELRPLAEAKARIILNANTHQNKRTLRRKKVA